MRAEWLAIPDVAGPIGWTLLHSFWQGFVVWIVLKYAVGRIPRPDVRVRIGSLGLVAFVAMHSLTLAACARGPALGWPGGTSLTVGSRDSFVPLASPADGWFGHAVREADPLMPWLVVGWTLWTTWRLAACAHGVRRTRRTLERADPLPQPLLGRLERLAARVGVRAGTVRFVAATVAVGPGTIGWLRPFIFIPPALLMTMPPAQVEAIVAHELAHVLRRDYLLAAFQLAIEGLYSCNPFVRLIVARLNDDAEHACDRIALRHVADPLDYARALRFVAEEVVAADRLVMAATGGPIVARVRWILSPRAAERSGSAWTSLGIAGAAAALLLAASTLASASATRAEAKFLSERTLGDAVDEITAYDGDVEAVRAAAAACLQRSLPIDVERSITTLAATDHASSPAQFRGAFATLDEVAGNGADAAAIARVERFLLHALGADERDFSSSRLQAMLTFPATYARLKASAGDVRRLVNAGRFEEERYAVLSDAMQSLSADLGLPARAATLAREVALVPARQERLAQLAMLYNDAWSIEHFVLILTRDGRTDCARFDRATRRSTDPPVGRSIVLPTGATIVNRGQPAWSKKATRP